MTYHEAVDAARQHARGGDAGTGRPETLDEAVTATRGTWPRAAPSR
jgi:hypothetical protein